MDETLKTLLVKYISGNADESEKRAVRGWLAESSDNQEYFNSLKAGWDNGLHYPRRSAVDTDAAFNKMKARLGVADEAPVRRDWRWLKAAVIVGLIVLAGALGAGLLLFKKGQPPVPVLAASHEVSVPFGKMKKMILPDSTEVVLNAGSKLDYDAGFGEQHREVTLEGEGYFVVRHDAHLPFTVHARGFTVRDIGTVFTISAYPGHHDFRAAVMEGEVEVTGKPGTVKLKKNEVYQLKGAVTTEKAQKEAGMQPQPLPVVATQTDMESYSGWKDHLLVFNEETFDEVAQRLERTFDVKIRITSPTLAAIRYTGRFNKVANIHDALTIIKETTPIVYRISRDTIVISPEKK